MTEAKEAPGRISEQAGHEFNVYVVLAAVLRCTEEPLSQLRGELDGELGEVVDALADASDRALKLCQAEIYQWIDAHIDKDAPNYTTVIVNGERRGYTPGATLTFERLVGKGEQVYWYTPEDRGELVAGESIEVVPGLVVCSVGGA